MIAHNSNVAVFATLITRLRLFDLIGTERRESDLTQSRVISDTSQTAISFNQNFSI